MTPKYKVVSVVYREKRCQQYKVEYEQEEGNGMDGGRKTVEISVTKFGKIVPLWPYFKRTGQFLERLFSIQLDYKLQLWQNFKKKLGVFLLDGKFLNVCSSGHTGLGSDTNTQNGKKKRVTNRRKVISQMLTGRSVNRLGDF